MALKLVRNGGKFTTLPDNTNWSIIASGALRLDYPSGKIEIYAAGQWEGILDNE